MGSESHFYIDDSGSRDPDRKPSGATDPDWFALGGLIIDKHRVEEAKEAIAAFRSGWPELKEAPLHSYEIRNKQHQFRWLASASAARQERFMSELSALIVGLPIHVLACVVDRPGYNSRYLEPYGPRRWLLCRTAFNIAVERAAKVAIHRGSRLRVYVEQSDKNAEGRLKGYFDGMRADGLPFNASTSGKYQPLTKEQLHHTLLEFRVKTKESALMQFADLVLWPICKGGYDRSHRAYRALLDAGKLVDVQCTEENGLLGVKYSCFDR
jgi:hypothetical protein